MKTGRQLERYTKGVANHRRIEILRLIGKEPAITLEGVAVGVEANVKTVSAHTQRLLQAGLINKRYRGPNVEHTLSPYGKRMLKFLRTL